MSGLDEGAGYAFGLALLNFSAWMRRQAWLGAIYRRFPAQWRNNVSAVLAAPAHRRLRFERSAKWSTSLRRAPVESLREPTASIVPSEGGVNVHAYLRGQFGLAENARLYARALLASGYPVALCDIDIALPHSLDDRSLDAWIGKNAPYDVDIVFVNPDFLDEALSRMPHRPGKSPYVIACWFWELEQFPRDWLPAIDRVDEVMVSSAFVENAVRSVTDKPVTRVPVPVGDVPDSGLQREDFGLDTEAFIFLCTFDFNSFLERKNPFAVIDAFRKAFPPGRTDVRLVIKSSNGHRHPERLREVLNAVDGDGRILIRDDVIDRAHVHALQRCCDAYVSLHRSEGFGLGLAEAMRQGKPALATGYSGNLEFMNRGNSILVGYRLVPVEEGAYAHHDGQHWAEANITEAATAMRRLVDEPGLARRIGDQAAIDIREHFSREACASALVARLGAIHASISGRRSVAVGKGRP